MMNLVTLMTFALVLLATIDSADLNKGQILEITTNSEYGSSDRIEVTYQTHDDLTAGGFTIAFYESPAILYGWCSLTKPLPGNLPKSQEKVWEIKRTDQGLSIWCNGVTILDVALSDQVCDRDMVSPWTHYWGREVAKFKIDDIDTATVSYRVKDNLGGFELDDGPDEDEEEEEEEDAFIVTARSKSLTCTTKARKCIVAFKVEFESGKKVKKSFFDSARVCRLNAEGEPADCKKSSYRKQKIKWSLRGKEGIPVSAAGQYIGIVTKDGKEYKAEEPMAVTIKG